VLKKKKELICIRNQAHNLTPLTDLTKKGDFCWKKEAQRKLNMFNYTRVSYVSNNDISH
jgi:hypothetical protein